MHGQMQAFVASAVEAFGLRGPLYRFGRSLPDDAEGETWLPERLSRSGYVGLELCGAAEFDTLPFPDATAQTVVWVGAWEFSSPPRRMVDEMTRIVAPGGVLLVAAPVKPRAHADRPDYWQLTPASVGRLLVGMDATMVGWQGEETCPHTVYGIGFKRPIQVEGLSGADRFLKDFQARLDRLAKRIGPMRRSMAVAKGYLRGREFRRQQRNQSHIQFLMHLPVDRNAEAGFLQDLAQYDS